MQPAAVPYPRNMSSTIVPEYGPSNGLGDSIDDPSESVIREMLMALDSTTRSTVRCGSLGMPRARQSPGWSNGRLLLRRPGESQRALTLVSRERALHFFRLFAACENDALEALPWQPGDGGPRSA